MLLHHAGALLLLPVLQLPPRSQPPAAIVHANLVIKEGDGWLVCNKPPGMSSHDGENSLLSALASAGHPEMHPCHRLDAETSGVMLLAKREKAGELSACLMDATKLYRGIVKGAPSKKRGRWAQSLSPKAEGRRNPRGVAASRVEAVTDWSSTGASNGYLSVMDFTLRSGRTHQIRKHAAVAGVPLVGDTRYGDPKHAKQMHARYSFGGMALHAALLKMTIEGTEHTFEAPLPESWEALLSSFPGQALAKPSAPMPAAPMPAAKHAVKPRGASASKDGSADSLPPSKPRAQPKTAEGAKAAAVGSGKARGSKPMPPGAYPPKKKKQKPEGGA